MLSHRLPLLQLRRDLVYIHALSPWPASAHRCLSLSRLPDSLIAMSQETPKNVRSSHHTNPSGGLTLVIKLGTSSICDEKTHLPKLANLSLLVETVVQLRNLGHQVVLVTSGAVGVGLKRLNMPRRPKHLAQVQAVAAVGQGRLMALYDDLFGNFDQPIAQILLTRDTLAERSQYLNACNTFNELLHMGVIPIVNENDTVSHSEIRFGDNDTLSAVTAGMINADYLFLLTDVECLYTDNPRTNPEARAVRVVQDVAKLREEVIVSSPGSALGTGGMVTKLIAADLATAAGCATIITLGSMPQRIVQILEEIGEHAAQHGDSPLELTYGTYFLAKPNPMVDRKWWILHGLATYGSITVDSGAVRALIKQRSSLFAAGIVKVEGSFVAQQSVRVLTVIQDDDTGAESIVEVGKGIASYTAQEISRIKGCKSKEIVGLLGYVDAEYVIHRDNLVVTNPDLDWTKVVLKAGNRSPTDN
ncbi:Aspartate/glutamate/uridylate kinase [Polychytrium aggregatum]|uniref:Aspartate/glutamate/uridylate kinase n=1 Tax=Polychytrium aggregatum TaxID=110093 RepID=UPI0022FE349A|nr:Aspartate/glutamate/uridylate kinase [Polychytrium aggregatum]KAI9208499.1 Aspartate/glutamate/uridylate kinase [Polychytrium aggregatum]